MWPKKRAGISFKSVPVKHISGGVCVAVEQETLCVCEDRMEKLKDSFSRIIKPTTFAPKFPTISHGVPAEREELEEHPLIPKKSPSSIWEFPTHY